VIVDSGGWDAKKAMKATTSSRATASTDEGQPSSSEKKQRQHRMAAQTSVITATVAMPDVRAQLIIFIIHLNNIWLASV